MALLSSLSSMLKREGSAPSAVRSDGAPAGIQQARTRARQRLIGALLLLTIGVIGFPLLFESRPRPIPVDIPIEIPARDGAPPLVVPDDAGSRRAVAASPRRMPGSPDAADVITETPADAGRDVTPPEPVGPAVTAGRVALSPPSAAERTLTKPPSSPPAADAVRAQALLDGKVVAAKLPAASPVSSSAPTPTLAASAVATRPTDLRYIIQVGAFADPAAARETRLKVERLGLKTYTQVADTPAGPRTRVRVGPFAARAEADKAMARVKAAGVAATILTI